MGTMTRARHTTVHQGQTPLGGPWVERGHYESGPPLVRDPFVRGPVALELALILGMLLPALYGAMRVIRTWVYLAPEAPWQVELTCLGIAAAAILGMAAAAMAAGTVLASWVAQAWTVAELAARAGWKLVRR